MAQHWSEPMEALAAALVRGEAVNWPADAAHAEQARFLEMAAFHGVRSLLAYQLHRMDLWPRWPAAITARLTETARVDAALEVVYRLELERVVAAMGSAGVRPLLLKGVALAYRHYPEPSLRPRYDTDLLVHRTDLAAVGRAMHALGYRRSTLIPGDLVMPQSGPLPEDGPAGCLPRLRRALEDCEPPAVCGSPADRRAPEPLG